MRTFHKHQFGRIYASTLADVARVKAIIRELDTEQYWLMPPNMVTVFAHYPEVVDVQLFCEMDMDVLSAHCMREGIAIFAFDAGRQETPVGCLK